MSEFSAAQCQTAVAKLSPQQVAVLRRMARGLALKQIADELGLAEGTVRVYRELIYARLGVNNQSLAVRVATMAKVA